MLHTHHHTHHHTRSDDWMRTNGFVQAPPKNSGDEEKTPNASSHPLKSPTADEPLFDFGNIRVRDLQLPKPVCVTAETACKEAANIMSQNNFSQLPVVSSGQRQTLLGLVTMGQILSKVAHKLITIDQPVQSVMFKFNRQKNFVEVREDWEVKRLLKFFDHHSVAVVTDASGQVVCVVTKTDLVEYLLRQQQQQ